MLVKKKNELEELRVLFCLIEDVWENDDRIVRNRKCPKRCTDLGKG